MLTDITFTENGPVDVDQLNGLYKMVGWDRRGRRTAADTLRMLHVSFYSIAAHTPDDVLVGFARVCGDPYVVQVLDVITHRDFRRRGIATRCMQGVREHLEQSNYAGVTGTDASGIEGFYERFGFRKAKEATLEWRP
jgi:ribosomal protein S18 acetylase RimI-like enzyme